MYFLQISDSHNLCDYSKTTGLFQEAFQNLHPLKEKLEKLKEEISLPLDFICHCGDIAHSGAQLADVTAVKESLERLFPQVPLVVTAGNHDNRDLVQQSFLGKVSPPFVQEHSFGDLRVLSFDSSNGVFNSGEITEETATWLLEKLEEPKDTLLMSHHHLLDCQSPMPPLVSHPLFQKVLEKNHVLAYLTGHSHQGYEGKLGTIPYYTVGSFCFSTEDLGGGQHLVRESSAYHLFSYEKGQITLEKSGDLGFLQELGTIQK
ncbi:MAG: metallophosphoesterase [Eubacteriales bacterium]